MPSSLIRRFQYDQSARRLSIWFVPTGLRYDYDEVPVELYQRFRGAFSKGRFFNDHIRDRFPYRCIGDSSR